MYSFESFIISGILFFFFLYFGFRIVSLLSEIRDTLKRAHPNPGEAEKPKKEYPDFDKLGKS
jgi:hypothetical protein